jgi:acid phosphatase type 7
MANLFRLLASGVLTAAIVAGALLLRDSGDARDAKPAKAPVKPDPPGAPRFLIAPYLQFPTRTSITIMWETDLPGRSEVEYGVGALVKKMAGPDGVTNHEIQLTNLKPNTAYLYRTTTIFADGQTLVSELLTFQTAVDPDSAFSFILIGDTQKNPKMTKKIAELAWRRRPNFVVHLGDVVDNGPDKNEWLYELFGPCRNLFARVAVFPAIGNHEKNHDYYYRYFALPAPEYYYRYRYGNADFFSIDTNKNVDAGSEQYDWLDRELGRSDAAWKFVYHHHPAYSSDENDWGDTWKGAKSSQGDPNVRRLVPLYEKHHVDMVFNGHIHLYERTWPLRAGKVDRKNGVIYVTSGGGGGGLENFAPVPTWFKAECRSDFHFCHISIQGRRLSLRAIDQRDVLFDLLDIEK